jgi:phosphoribosylformylglycinamidine synthase
MRNVTAAGAFPAACAQCLNFGDPADYKQLSQLAEALRGISDACRAWDIPIITDSISLRNGTAAAPSLPTPALVMVGVLSDISHACPCSFQTKGDCVLLLGTAKEEVSCSEYAHYSRHRLSGNAPDIDFLLEKKTCECVFELHQSGLLRSAHDLAAGGLAAALVESCLNRPRPIGAKLNMVQQNVSPLAQLFGETSGRFLVSCTEAALTNVRTTCNNYGVPISAQGVVGGKEITLSGALQCSMPLSTARRLWRGGLDHLFQDTSAMAANG